MRKVLVVGAVAFMAVAGACAKQEAPVTKVHIAAVGQDAKATTFEQIEGGKPGFGPGDSLIEVSPVTVGGKTTGSAYTTITIVAGKKLEQSTGLIDCHVQLDGGTVIFNGGFAFKDLGTGVELPIVGGTGSYAGAGGTVKMQVPDQTKTNMTFDLLIPRTTS